MKKNPWTNSIFTRLVLTFLLITLPIYGIGATIFFISRNTLQSQYYNNARIHIRDFLTEFENEMVQTQQMLNYLTLDEDLSGLAGNINFAINYDYARSINRLRRRLSYVKDTNRYMEWVSVYVPSIGMKINSIGQFPSIDRIDYTYYQNLNGYQQRPDFFALSGERLYLYASSVRKHPVYTDTPLYVIEAGLDAENMYERMMMYNTDSIFYFILPDNQYILTNGDHTHMERILSFINENPDAGGDAPISAPFYNGHMLIQMHSTALNAYYLQLTPEEIVFGGINRLFPWYLLLSCYSLVVIFLFLSYMYRLIKKPVNRLMYAFQSLRDKNFEIQIEQTHRDEFGYLFESFNQTIKQLKHLIFEVYLQKLLVNQAEFKQLQAQINPHFLYNSLFTLQAWIRKKDFIGAERFCGLLGVYFRYVTENNMETATLSAETEHARIYAEIQAIRFSNRVTVVFDPLPDTVQNLMVPKLILQPIIENAFKYGLEEKKRNGMLRISFHLLPKGVLINVEDNGFALDDAGIANLSTFIYNDNNESTGLMNIHKRLTLYMDTGSGLSFAKSGIGGLGVTIKLIPKDTEG